MRLDSYLMSTYQRGHIILQLLSVLWAFSEGKKIDYLS